MKKLKEPPKPLRLNIAGGQQRIEGYTNIDIAKIPETDIVHDLNVYPWPIKSESVTEALCSHYLEHIPHDVPNHPGKEGLFLFFNELYRIMVPEGKVQIITPYYANGRAFQDPTHRRFINEATYLYANKGWREQNKLDHYPVHADFDFSYSYSVVQEWALRGEDARQFAMKHYIGIIADLQAFLTKRSRSPTDSSVLVKVADSDPRINGKANSKLRRSVCKV